MKHALYNFTMSKGQTGQDALERYFTSTGFIDLLPLALEIAGKLGLGRDEMIEAVCKVADKSRVYPPIINRAAWFRKVYREKLLESRADILAFNKRRR